MEWHLISSKHAGGIIRFLLTLVRRCVVTLLRADFKALHVLRGGDLNLYLSPGATQIGLGGLVTDRVLVSEIPSDFAANVLDFFDVLRKERSTASALGERLHCLLTCLR